MTMSEDSWMARCLEDLLPLMHMIADLRMAKESLHLNHPMRAVGHVTFEREQVGQAFVKGLCFYTHAS